MINRIKASAWPTPNCHDVNAFSYTCMAAISVVPYGAPPVKDRLTSYTMNARDRVRKRQIVTEDIISGIQVYTTKKREVEA